MEIFTSRYHNKIIASGKYTPIGISQGEARFLKFTPTYLKALAPTWAMVKITDKKVYRRAYFKQLNGIDIESVKQMLEPLSNGKPIVLLCFEDLRKPNLWCHRTMFAEWFEKQTGQKIEELEEGIDNKRYTTPQLSLF
jgi:hypothetical protein